MNDKERQEQVQLLRVFATLVESGDMTSQCFLFQPALEMFSLDLNGDRKLILDQGEIYEMKLIKKRPVRAG